MNIKKHLFVLVFSLSFFGFSQSDSTIIKEVMQVLNAQENAWNVHDLETFMAGYWNADALVFVGSKGPTYGWKPTLEKYKKGYPTPELMGQLAFEVLNTVVWDKQTVQMIGKFTLTRKEDQPQGYFSLLWRKIEGQWRIVSDHSSASAK